MLFVITDNQIIFKGVHGTKIKKLAEVPEVLVSVLKIFFPNSVFYFGLQQIDAEDLLSKLPNLSSLFVFIAEPVLSVTKLWVRFGNGEQRFGNREFGTEEKRGLAI